MTQPLQRFTHQSEKKATHSIIWLHGLGADGYDFASLIPELHLRPTTRAIFPHAPMRPITLNGGQRMRGWYDIADLNDFNANEDLTGIADSARQINEIFAEEEAAGVAAGNILLAGFSQGGVMALQVGLHRQCAGILALSTYLSNPANCPDANPADTKPILQMHGSEDPIIPIVVGRAALKTLHHHRFAAAWRDYPMQHQVCAEQISDIATWLHELGF